MHEPYLNLRILPSGVAIIVLDLEDSKVNVLSAKMMEAINATIDTIVADKTIKGLIVASSKLDNFIAGADITEICAIQKAEPIKAYEASQLGKQVFDKISNLRFNTVAAINGACLGGGTELALACKYRLATNSAKTTIGLPEVNLGFIPGWGGTVRLPRLIGLQSALDLISTGKNLKAKKAWQIGLVDEVVEEVNNLLARAEQVALTGQVHRFILPFPARLKKLCLEGNALGQMVIRNVATKTILATTKGHYPAPLEALKVALTAVSNKGPKAFTVESRAFAQLAASKVSRNLVGIWGAQQESKKTDGAINSIEPGINIKTVGIIGAGIMGAGIAQAAAYAGYKVILHDVSDTALDKGMSMIHGLFSSLVAKHKLTSEDAKVMQTNINSTNNFSGFADCELVIEAVLEDIKVKKEVLSELKRYVKNADFIFATNTSSLSVRSIAEDTNKPANIVGIHFFNPVHKMPLVEIIYSQETSSQTIAAAKAFASKLGKTTVTVSDSPGFVVNRILAPYLREAIALLENGVPAEDIDKAMTSFGMPMGPLALLDEIGLDIAGKVIHVLHQAFGARLAPPNILSVIATQKLTGKKGGKGIYLYDENGRRIGLNPSVLNAIKAKRTPKTRGEIQDRLVLVMVNEAIRCLEEKVVLDPAQLDLAMIMGTGFPPFRGGILRYADEISCRVIHQKLEYLAMVSGDNYKPCALLTAMASQGEVLYG